MLSKKEKKIIIDCLKYSENLYTTNIMMPKYMHKQKKEYEKTRKQLIKKLKKE